ncbi:unnamed protein product [Rotaria sordida]|uniref:RNA helicase n=1 Tax=Rotaria sordida TaxID=392033 RepID=A0A819FK53_9BILA|nr:unnamed protein product [Rotaria sordida]
MPGTHLQVEKIEPHEKDKSITLVYLQEQSVTRKEVPMPTLMSSEHQYEQTPSVKLFEFYEQANLDTQVLSNICRVHFEEPTPVQCYTIPCIREEDDIIARAQTGFGKTAAFLPAIISNLIEYYLNELYEKHDLSSPFCLILSPTREVVLQTERSAVSGHDMFYISNRLQEGCHISSATTGHLKAMISLTRVKYFVLDQADQMLDKSFESDVCKLEAVGLLSKYERFTFMFSATFFDEVRILVQYFIRDNYISLVVGKPDVANEDIAQTIEEMPNAFKKDQLFQLFEQSFKSEPCLIFVKTNRTADYIKSICRVGSTADLIQYYM